MACAHFQSPRSFILTLATAALVTTTAMPALAQGLGPVAAPSTFAPSIEAATITIKDIRVEGAQRLETETVLSHLSLVKGDEADPERIDASLKSLYATGLFADAHISMVGDVLVVNVTENPIINRITYEGNDAVSKDDLEKEVQLKPRQVYTLTKVQRDVQRILEVYRRSGRFGATVNPKIVKLDQNRVDLVFEIDEGKRTGVRNIAFVGNQKFDGDKLKETINTRESAWWRFLSATDYYDPDRLNYDKELLRKFYLNEGYVDFRVVSAVAELTPDHDDFFLTFTLEEGARYKVGKVTLTSAIKGLDAESLRQFLTFHEGDWYSADQVEKSVTKLTNILGDKQYAFVSITPQMDRHKETTTVDLHLDIKQGERVYIGRIEISGNSRTEDQVIRRQIKLAEGDPYNTTLIHKSEQNLKDLGFFETAKITTADGAQPDRANLKVDVKDKSTGQVAIGAGFSSTDGPLGDFSISEHNFMGRGQDARVGATISGRTKQLDTSFTEPYFLGRDLSAGVDAYHTSTNNQDLSSYDTNSTGFSLRGGYPLSEELRQRVNYSFHDDSITNVPDTASLYILDQQGTTVTSSVGQGLTFDTRDSKLEPTLGYILHLDTDVAGVGGSRKWFRVRTGGTQYYPLAENYILSGLGEVGKIWGLNGPTKINERFFLGGDTLRGFQYAGLGPRDLTSTNQDALGGTQFARGTMELSMPTPLPQELGLKAHLFVDGGVLDHVDEQQIPGDTFTQDGNLRLSTGIGISWASPFGPVRLDFAEPIMKQSYDKLEHIHFSFGTNL
ncbi:MAG: outer membrane protein assembly factor BamA [Alphaproteobacteria bacterium]|nr:outer membrane protein assembly factor BamA [Alphaproteobacteria bacterium]MBV8548181.1 outer membrane protein assembly factor BamA [Alphaproteobacteria bacterium]